MEPEFFSPLRYLLFKTASLWRRRSAVIATQHVMIPQFRADSRTRTLQFQRWTMISHEANHQSSVDATRRGRKVTIGAPTVPIWAHGEWAEPAKRPWHASVWQFYSLFSFHSVETYACFSPPDIYSSNTAVCVWNFTAFPILLSSSESELTKRKP